MTPTIRYRLELNAWGSLFVEKLDWMYNTVWFDTIEELEKAKEQMIDDVIGALDDDEICELVRDVGLGYAVRIYWDKIKDREDMQNICKEEELCKPLLKCILTADIGMEEDT